MNAVILSRLKLKVKKKDQDKWIISKRDKNQVLKGFNGVFHLSFMENNNKINILSLFLGVIILGLTSCVPQGDKSRTDSIQTLIQSPELSGDFENQNQLSSIDRVFTITKSGEDEESELTLVSLVQEDSIFSIQTNGCERSLKRQEKCFVRVKLSGSKLQGESAGIKTALLKVGSLEIPLSVNYDPLLTGSIEVSAQQSSIEEKMDYECLSSSCDLILRYKNKGLVAQQTAGVVVPLNYMIVVNSCNSSILPNKSCAIRLRLKNIPDLDIGEVVLNVSGQAVSTNIRVVQEHDNVAPSVSPNVLNAVDIEGDLYVQDLEAQLELTFSDNREVSKGLKYSVTSGSVCSSSNWISTNQEINTVNVPLISNQNNVISIMVKDALENVSSCVLLTVRDLNYKTFAVNITQPTIGGSVLSSSSTSVPYLGSVLINYNSPGAGYQLLNWSGSCSGQTGSSCSVLNISQDITVGAEVSCAIGYHQSGTTCVADTQSCPIDNGTGLQTWEGSSWGACVLQSCSANFVVNNNNDACMATIVANGSSRNWADGSFAQTCDKYKNPTGSFKYQGSVGNGVYKIKPTSAAAFDVYCNMTEDSYGWTLVMKQKQGDGATLQGDTAYWTNSATAPLADTVANMSESDVNFVSRAFTQVPGVRLMMKVSNSTTRQFKDLVFASPFAAFQAVNLKKYSDDCNSNRPNWFINATTYPNGTAILSSRFEFNHGQVVPADTNTIICGARWGWTANENACGLAPGSHDACGGLGGYGTNYGLSWMSNNKGAWQPGIIMLYVR